MPDPQTNAGGHTNGHAASQTQAMPGTARIRKRTKKKVATSPRAAPAARTTPRPGAAPPAALLTAFPAAAELRSGFLKTLASAGPDWTPRIQDNFLTALKTSLPFICGAGNAGATPIAA